MAENQSREPNTWFAVLRAAHEANDRDLAAMARRELDSLGYRVTVRRDAPPMRQEPPPCRK